MNYKQKFKTQQLLLKYIIQISMVFIIITAFTNDQDNAGENKKAKKKVNLELIAAQQFVTAKGTSLALTESDTVKFEDFVQCDEHVPTLILDPGKTFQIIEGFGGALTDASAETFYKLPDSIQEEILNAYFDRQKGIGYTLCRTHINSCDFSSESYAYSEVEGDTDLKHFSIDHDKRYRIPFIRAAILKAGYEIKFFASPWSPPAWMKTNNHMLKGGKLKPEYRQTWADYFVKFIKAYENNGIKIWGVTVQNEPMAVQTWESCIYTAEEERDFVKNYLGPTLEKAGLENRKIIIWDHNRGIMYQRASVVYDDPEAYKYVWGTGFHWYTGDHFNNVKLLQEAYPEKKNLFTEGCVFPFDYLKTNEWHWGERYGESIIHDLNNSAVGWVDWNILVDETGGPNHVANFCYAPLIGNTITGELIYMNSYYYIGHFSKFIYPGARRIICSSNYDDLLATAMLNPDNSIALVVMNPTDKAIKFKTWISNRGFTATSNAHSIATFIFN